MNALSRVFKFDSNKINTMKRFYVNILVIGFATVSFAQNVSIPDANFKAYLVGNTSINTNGDSEIQMSEAQAYSGLINCSTQGIADLTGIEAFTSLTKLTCTSNQLTNLDLTSNTALTELRCASNQIQSLDITACPLLTILNCRSNEMTSLDISNNTSLTYLECWGNQLTTLDLSSHSSLSWINCSSNLLTNLSLPSTGAATYLSCGVNELTALDVSGLLQLETLNFSGNQLTSIDLSLNASLTDLYCTDNLLTSLDVSNNTSLEEIWCQDNSIISLDFSNNVVLIAIEAQNNSLTSLNVANGNNANFTKFYAFGSPDLTCVKVDDAAYSTANWTGGYFSVGATATFSEDCNGGTIGIDQVYQEQILIYPNPTSGCIDIQCSDSSKIQKIKIIDLSGKLVMEQNAGSSADLSFLSNGTYFVQIETDFNSITKKFVKY